MAQFIVDIVIGGIFGFFVCVILRVNNSDKDKNTQASDDERAGENGNRS